MDVQDILASFEGNEDARRVTLGEVKELIADAVLRERNAFREQLEQLIEEAWIDYRSAVPGDTDAVTLAITRSQTLRTVRDVLDGVESG